MTTTELIAILQKYEYGGATSRAREVMFCIGERIYHIDIKDISTGDGLFTELFIGIEAEQT